jgi:hypothetical protein
MEKRPPGRTLLSWSFLRLPPMSFVTYNPTARRRLMTERSERMSEEAEYHQMLHAVLPHGGFREQRTTICTDLPKFIQCP